MYENKDFLSNSEVLLELDRLDFENSKPKDSLPDVHKQKRIISKFLNCEMNVLEIWCLIEKKWFDSWKEYVGFQKNDKHRIQKPPGRINNEGLIYNLEDVRSSSVYSVAKLKKSIVQGEDYEVIPFYAFSKLLGWFGGFVGGYAPTIPRPTFLFHEGHSQTTTNDKKSKIQLDLNPKLIYCGTFMTNQMQKMEYRRIRVFSKMKLSDIKMYIIEKFGVFEMNHSIEATRILVLKKNVLSSKSSEEEEEENEEENEEQKLLRKRQNYGYILKTCEYEEIELGNLVSNIDGSSSLSSIKLILECRMRFKEFYFDKFFNDESHLVENHENHENFGIQVNPIGGGEIDVSLLPSIQQKILLQTSNVEELENVHRFRRDLRMLKEMYEREKKKNVSLEKQFSSERKKVIKRMKKRHNEESEKQKVLIINLREKIKLQEENLKSMAQQNEDRSHELKTKLIRYCEERIALKTNNVMLEKSVREKESKLLKLGPVTRIFTVSETDMNDEKMFSNHDLRVLKSEIFQNIHLMLSKIRIVDEIINQRRNNASGIRQADSQSSLGESNEKCSICHDNQKNIVLIPCGHLICGSCYEEMFVNRNRRKCPYCSKKVTKTQKIFLNV